VLQGNLNGVQPVLLKAVLNLLLFLLGLPRCKLPILGHRKRGVEPLPLGEVTGQWGDGVGKVLWSRPLQCAVVLPLRPDRLLWWGTRAAGQRYGGRRTADGGGPEAAVQNSCNAASTASKDTSTATGTSTLVG
jgi:hypothetical protein